MVTIAMNAYNILAFLSKGIKQTRIGEVLFMEFLIELLFEIVVEGSIELGSEKTVPIPLRILAAFIVLAVFFGMGGLVIYMGYDEILNGDKTAAIALFVVGIFFMFGGMFIILKMFRKKKEKLDKN